MVNTGPKRTKLQRQLDRETVARLTLQGWSQLDIAQFLEVDQSTVSRYLRAIQQQWKESAIRDFDLDRQRELQRLSLLEKEYWAGWQRSQEGKETSVNEKLVTGKDQAGNPLGRVKLATRTEQKIGEATFLNGIQKVIDARCKLLGLYPTDENSASQVSLSDAQLSVIGSLMRESHEPSN